MEEREEFKVVDKRRVRADAASGEDASVESAGEQEAGAAAEEPEKPAEEMAEGAGAEERIPLPDLSVTEVLLSFIGMLQGFAWQKMGLRANPATGKVETDLPQARIAIDTVQFMVGQVEPQMPETEKRELRRVVMDLQMNFVRMRGSSGG